jgi:gliding motility-associated-like protein
MKKKYLFLILLVCPVVAFSQVPVANFTANVTEGCGTLIVTFTDLSTNSPTSWLWTFGDGTAQSTQHNPTHAYNTPGTYNVTLKVTNSSGSNTLTKNAYIKVYHLPSPDFTGVPLSGCSPLLVQYTNSTVPGDYPITTWHWDFGDGFSSSAQNPSHTYNSPGNYQVTLSATDQKGCQGSKIKPNYIMVGSKPVANFTYSSLYACHTPIIFNFTNTTLPSGCTYSWNFGDGGTSTQTSPSHNYNSAGNYTVTLIATSNGCPDTAIHVVNAQVNPFYPNFSASPTSGCAPLTVNFSDLSPSGVNSWLWKFGDGATSTLQNPSHTYTNPGTYTVKLIATNTNGCIDSITHSNYITVYANPTISFSGTPLFACDPNLNVQFNSVVTGATLWQWDFGDGGTGNTQNPLHTYTTNGVYTVTLIATDNHGCTSTLTKPNYVVVDPTTADFSMTPTKGCKPLNVQFTDQSDAYSYISTWSWNYGDGSPLGNGPNPNHIYTDTGSYMIVLTIIDSAGCIRHDTNFVKVGMKPTALFYAEDTVGCHPFTANFHDSSSNFVNYWSWQFGDGATSNLENPEHEYTDTGYFDVELIVEHNGCGDTLEIENYILVLPPKPEFSATPTISCVYPVNVQFTDQSILPETWFWDFGDGGTSTIQNPSHNYLNPGFYTVKLVVSNSNGCKDSLVKNQYIKISEIIPDFTQTDTEICNDESSTFMSTTFTNTFSASWTWDFGDGTTTTGFIATHTWANPGVYPVQLIVSDGLGCYDSITKPTLITVNALPHPGIIADVYTGCAPLTVNFNSLSTAVSPATLVYWYWNFGDGGIIGGTNQNPTHIYTVPGLYMVIINVVDSKGCDTSAYYSAYIYVTFPQVDFDVDSINCSGDTVYFHNETTGAGLHYTWDFGDGSPTSSLTNPYHIYTVGQTTSYTVSLYVSDTNSCDSIVAKNIVISKPVADFTSNTFIANCPPLFVNFSDTSSSDALIWEWNFGDTASGTNNNSYISDPQHFYNASGTYDVSLVVTNIDGCTDTIIKPDFIIINGPTGTFSYQPTEGCSPVDITFLADAQSTTSYFWIFGEGSADTTSGDSIVHTYFDGGSFVPTLVLIDSIHNCQLTISGADTIHIISGFANFSYSSYIPCSDSATIYFFDSSFASQPITSWYWEFGDGGTSTQQNPSHFYNTNGSFDVTLTITVDSCTWTYSISDVVTIFVPPDVEFNIGSTSTCYPPLTTDFTIDSSTLTYQAIAFDWDFGDSTTHSNQASPSHDYYESGTYFVTVVITFANGCQHSYSMPVDIYAYEMPVAGFYPDTNNVMTGYLINFINTSEGTDLSWNWSFGDGSTSSIENPSYTYEESGQFPVILIVSTPNGCLDTAYYTMYVIENIIIPNVFTPNGDGFNDVFNIISSGFPNYKLIIYNRWGKVVYENTNPYTYWDGTTHGEPAAVGTYFYVLEISNSEKELKFEGTVTLLR